MRRALLAGVLIASAAVPAAAGGAAPKPVTVASYCSSTGDLCLGIFRKQGAIFLDLRAAARYFDRYSLCVRTPKGRTSCREFRLRRDGVFFASSVRWHTNFPAAGRGRYHVTWRLRAPLGPSLTFVLRG